MCQSSLHGSDTSSPNISQWLSWQHSSKTIITLSKLNRLTEHALPDLQVIHQACSIWSNLLQPALASEKADLGWEQG